MNEPPSSLDVAAFAQILDRCVSDHAATVRHRIHETVGPDGIDTLNMVLRPRVLQLQVDVRDDPYDWGAIYRQADETEAGPLNIIELGRRQREQVLTGLLIMFGPMLAWWSTATDVPIGLEHTWWLATSLIEIGEDPECDEHEFDELERHLRLLLIDAERIIDGALSTVITEISHLDDDKLADRTVETAEDVAQLMLPMGATVLLDELLGIA